MEFDDLEEQTLATLQPGPEAGRPETSAGAECLRTDLPIEPLRQRMTLRV